MNIETRLAGESNGRDILAIPANIDHHGCGLKIVVVDVVMNRLEIPGELARLRVEDDQGVAKQIIAGTIATPEIRGRRAEGQEDQATLGIDRRETPDVRSRAVLPAIASPRVVTDLTWPRDRVEAPYQFAGVNVPGPYVASGPFRRVLPARRRR